MTGNKEWQKAPTPRVILTVSIVIIEDVVHVARLESTVAIFVNSVPKCGDLCPNNVLELFQSRM